MALFNLSVNELLRENGLPFQLPATLQHSLARNLRFPDRQIAGLYTQELGELPQDGLDTDYRVSCFYREMLNILPDLMQPVPDDLHRLILNADTCERWLQYGYELQEQDSCQAWDAFEQGWQWFEARSLFRLGHVDLSFWRNQNTIYIRWNNRAKQIAAWERILPPRATVNVAYQRLMQEIIAFSGNLVNKLYDYPAQQEATNPDIARKLDFCHQICSPSELYRARLRSPHVEDWQPVRDILTQHGFTLD